MDLHSFKGYPLGVTSANEISTEATNPVTARSGDREDGQDTTCPLILRRTFAQHGPLGGFVFVDFLLIATPHRSTAGRAAPSEKQRRRAGRSALRESSGSRGPPLLLALANLAHPLARDPEQARNRRIGNFVEPEDDPLNTLGILAQVVGPLRRMPPGPGGFRVALTGEAAQFLRCPFESLSRKRPKAKQRACVRLGLPGVQTWEVFSGEGLQTERILDKLDAAVVRGSLRVSNQLMTASSVSLI